MDQRLDQHDARLKRIRTIGLVLTALSFLVVLVSAYIRLNGAGLGCAGWPDCYGQLLAGGPHPHSGAVRILHRVVASIALLLGFYLVAQCLRPVPLQPVVRHATQLLVLMLLLTLVGLWSSNPQRAWTSFVNMLGGLGLVSLSWRVALEARSGPAAPPSAATCMMLRAGLVALCAALALGALIGARYAAVSCLSTPACGGVWWPAAEGWAALDPFTRVAAPTRPGDAGGVTLHLLHRYCAVLALLLLGGAGLRALRAAATRTPAMALLALLVVELALGSLTVASGFQLWLAIAHSVCAAALLAVTLQLYGAGLQVSRPA